MSKDRLFIERRRQGGYAILRPNSERASAVLPTQSAAIARAKEMAPESRPLVDRVRFTEKGSPDKWRKP